MINVTIIVTQVNGGSIVGGDKYPPKEIRVLRVFIKIWSHSTDRS